jgi:hypothetical protein
MPAPRESSSMSFVNGKVYIQGGINYEAISEVEGF